MLYLHNDIFLTYIICHDRLKFGKIYTTKLKFWLRHCLWTSTSNNINSVNNPEFSPVLPFVHPKLWSHSDNNSKTICFNLLLTTSSG